MSNVSKGLARVGVILILVTGLIHLIEAPDSFGEAFYKGLLFCANGLGALVAAWGIYKGSRTWGWTLGLVIALGSFLGYVASRTVGLPGLPPEPDAWLEPMGVASLIVESLFIAAFLKTKAKEPDTF